MGAETCFRASRVRPFLNKLKNTHIFPQQQLSFIGVPDFILCIRGRFVALELKADNEDPRPKQDYELSRVVKAGGIAIVAKPCNWRAVAKQLQNLDEGEEW